MKELTVGSLKALPGEKVQGYLEEAGIDAKIPVTLICGIHPGMTAALCSGTHGGEFLGVETAIELAASIKPEEVHGSLIFTHPSNVPQFMYKTAYVGPDDGKNLNRVFPGRACGTVSERIAYLISSQILDQSDFYIDMHSGDIHEDMIPYVIYSGLASEETNRISAKAASLMGAEYYARSVMTTTGLGYCASRGIPGILPEIGGCARWSPEEVRFYERGVRNVLKYLKILDGPVEDLGESRFISFDEVYTTSDGLWYPAVKKSEEVSRGQKLGELRDFFGNVIESYYAEKDGHILFVCSALSLFKGDLVMGIG